MHGLLNIWPFNKSYIGNRKKCKPIFVMINGIEHTRDEATTTIEKCILQKIPSQFSPYILMHTGFEKIEIINLKFSESNLSSIQAFSLSCNMSTSGMN